MIDNEYIMSPKDLCTIDFLDQILATGVKVLKLEGRGRSREYVKTVTQCYKEAAQAVLDDTYTSEKGIELKASLDEVYNRGFWDGYYLGQKLGERSEAHGSVATKQKTFVGKVLHYYPEPEVAHIRIKTKEMRLHDPILIIGDTTGVIETTVESLWVNDQPSELAGKGAECTIKIPVKVQPGDNLYLWEDRS